MDSQSTNEQINEALRSEILAMVETDQKMRKSNKWDSDVDRHNTARLKEIIDQYGWPGFNLVAKDGAFAAWLIAQHADDDPEFQQSALSLLEETVGRGDADKSYVAFLTDRVRVNNGEQQLFGTQFGRQVDGTYGPHPIHDLDSIEERRKEFGLEPFADYKKGMMALHQDLEKKRRADDR
jgi:hypothetical protein